MDEQLFQNLLYQEESETLDFKSEQYKFANASKVEKSELLKDILAFANSWRTTDAYILIGVEEVKGGKSKIVGIDQHILNRNLQQFVSKKTNRPIEFFYRQFTIDDLNVGIINIPTQERPIFLNKNYGKLSSNRVYIRRSDTTTIAKPDEIARMGAAFEKASLKQPNIELKFANLDKREKLETDLTLNSTKLYGDNLQDFPTYGSNDQNGYLNPAGGPNPNYYRDIAKYLMSTHHLNKLGIVVGNKSDILAENIIIKITLNVQDELSLFDQDSFPEEPSKTKIPLVFNNVRSIFENFENKNLDVNKYGDKWYVESNFGNLQPKSEAWSVDNFFIGSSKSKEVKISVKIIADNLKEPIISKSNISFDTKTRQIDSGDMMECIEKLEN